jgi:hypothetical protein
MAIFLTVIDRRVPASGYGGHSGEMSASVFVTQPQAILRGFEKHSEEKEGLLGKRRVEQQVESDKNIK